MAVYVVATTKPWNRDEFLKRQQALPGEWHLVERAGDLTPEFVLSVSPRYIFFPHWSWRVADDIWRQVDCVCFHMTDVPYGRGGSPLQNLIVRGHENTVISALRMVDELDAGPVYLKAPLSLEGNAQQIFERASRIMFDLIEQIVVEEPEPVAQTGEAVMFTRRTPEQSRLLESASLKTLYDHIRMLDAEGYPRAFLDHGDCRLEFSAAEFDAAAPDQAVAARVIIRKR